MAIRAGDQLTALHSEADRRQLTLPAEFTIPDPALWGPGYRAEAQRASGQVPTTVEAAVDVVKPFLDPLLGATAAGRWDAGLGSWSA